MTDTAATWSAASACCSSQNCALMLSNGHWSIRDAMPHAISTPLECKPFVSTSEHSTAEAEQRMRPAARAKKGGANRAPCASTVQRYEKLGLLGSGGAAVVYLVRHRDTKELFAMKVQRTSEETRQVRCLCDRCCWTQLSLISS